MGWHNFDKRISRSNAQNCRDTQRNPLTGGRRESRAEGKIASLLPQLPSVRFFSCGQRPRWAQQLTVQDSAGPIVADAVGKSEQRFWQGAYCYDQRCLIHSRKRIFDNSVICPAGQSVSGSGGAFDWEKSQSGDSAFCRVAVRSVE